MKQVYIFLMLSVTSAAFAQTWIAPGIGTQSWNVGGNWSGGMVPGVGATVIFDGSSAADCQLNASVTIGNIQINGFNGKIDLNSFDINATNGVNDFKTGTVVGTGHVNISSTAGATFDGTDFGANAEVIVTLTSSSGIYTGGPGTTFDGKVTVTAHSILLNGSTYNSTTKFVKSDVAAPTNSIGDGGNTFNGSTTIVNDMNATLSTGNVTADAFNAALELAITGTSSACRLEMAHTSTGNTFQNIRVRSDNDTGLQLAAITFGGGGGTSSMGSGYTIDEVTPGFDLATNNEFNFGDLILNNFTQLGNTAQSINLRIPNAVPSVNNLRFYLNACTFNGAVTFLASNPYVSNCTFNGVTTLTKTTGSGTDGSFGPPPHPVFTWDGGNTFNSTTTIRNLGQCTLVLGGTSGDRFNSDVTFNANQALSKFMIATNGTTYFLGNISLTQAVNGPSFEFGHNGGLVSIEGTVTQTLSCTATVGQPAIPTFAQIDMKNSTGLTLSTPIIVSTSLNLSSGIITASSSSNYVSILASGSVTNASNASFIDGPVRKTGNAAFVFPVGDGGYYHPMSISAPANIADEFAARYFAADHGLGYTADVLLKTVSDCEYWTLDRLVGSSDPTVTLSWNSPFCRANYITLESALRVARWSGTQWNNLGGVPVIGPFGDVDGIVTATSALPNAASHTITLGSEDAVNVLPIILDSFTANHISNGIELRWSTAYEHNNSYFTVERLKGNDFISLADVPAAKPGNSPNRYRWVDENPMAGRSYYRLKQTDLDGAFSYSEAISIETMHNDTPYPNPVKETLYLDDLALTENSRVVLTDVTGHIVYSGASKKSLDVSHLKAGIYHLSVTSRNDVKRYAIKKE